MSGPDPLCKMVAQTFMEMGKQDLYRTMSISTRSGSLMEFPV